MRLAEVFVDTSALYALFAKRDRNHARARDSLLELRNERASLLTSTTVLTESYVLVHARTGREGLLRFRRAIARSQWLRAVDVSSAWETEAWDLLEAQIDKDYSFVDATSFVLMSALEVRRAFSFDIHFAQAGFDVMPESPANVRDQRSGRGKP